MVNKQTEELGDIVAQEKLAAYCPDLAQWPTIWHYEERDLIPGEQMVAVFKPFLLHLLNQDLSRKTLHLHRDNLWMLGGEIIRDLHETPQLRKRPAREVVLATVDGGEGPLLHGGSEQEQRSFDSTCKKMYRFLTAS
ncbi:MAG: hypothetical protein Q7U82_04905 [Gammaproteobacteria bacterium]|nr:hypothetical protein [Gammaproteobacteria bacterium]